MRPSRTLLPLNGQLEIAGEIFFNNQVGLELDERIVFIWHPRLGELSITETDGILLRFLDMGVPTRIRVQMRDQGWKTMTVKQLLDYVMAFRSTQED